MSILDACPHIRKIIQQYLHLSWAEIDDIMPSVDEPWKSTITYKVEKDDGTIVYGTEYDDSNLYEKLLDHLIQCHDVDEETKQWAKQRKKEINEKWKEFISNQ